MLFFLLRVHPDLDLIEKHEINMKGWIKNNITKLANY